MKSRPILQIAYFPLQLILFYFISLFIWRCGFIYFNDISDVMPAVSHSLQIDFSMICALLLLLFIPWIIYLIFGFKLVLATLKYFNIGVWCLICVVEYASILLYKEWGTTVDSRAVSYLLHPNEAWASTRDFIPFWLTLAAIGMVVLGIKMINIIFKSVHPYSGNYFSLGFFLLATGGASFLGLRGGWQKLPIVPSTAFYSTDMKSNFAAANKVWYMVYSMVKNTDLKVIYPEKEVNSFMVDYKVNNAPCKIDSTTISLKNKNIVFIILEGWSADMLQYLGGQGDVAPFTDSLSNHCVRFTNAFSTGFRTDQGLMSIQCGVPSVHSLNMPNVITKVSKYPSLCKNLEAGGYQSSFVYGGDLNFSNLNNFLAVQGFDTIISEKNFANAASSTDWGVPDHIMLEKAVTILDSHDSLFFSTILLMSSHSPFDVPWPNEFTQRTDIPSKYKSSVRYSDQSLKRFFDMAKDKLWYANTVFFIMSDHGSTHSGYAGMEDQNRFRIPLLVFDPSRAMDGHPLTLAIPCNHFDLPFTVSSLAGTNSGDFYFGRNIFCMDEDRKAYWNVDVAAGYVGMKDYEIRKLQNVKSDSVFSSLVFIDAVKRWFNKL